MEKLRPSAVGKAVAVFTGTLTLICWIFVSITREGGIWLMNVLTHAFDWGSIGMKQITFVNGIIGLVVWMVLGYILGALYAMIYNKFAE